MNQRYAIVTGASKGIGLAVFQQLVEQGYEVCGLSRSQGQLPVEKWIPCDVTDADSIEEGFYQAIKRLGGRLDVCVLNAGIGISGAFEFTSERDYRRQMEVNVFGTIACARQAAQIMRHQQSGKIIFISSLAAIFPLPFQSFYSASKAAVNVISDAMGIELKPFSVETCTIMLNDVKTEFTDNRVKTWVGDDVYGGRIEASVSKMEHSEQEGMRPEDVARVICALLSRRKLPPHKIVGVGNEMLNFLYRILPTGIMLQILAKIYG